MTVPAGWSGQTLADKFLQGLAEWTGPTGGREVRTVLRVENGGTTFLLSGSTRGLDVGASISMVLGCNHKSGTPAQPDGDCGPLHHNIQNFGGQEYIPLKNPIGSFVNQFYGVGMPIAEATSLRQPVMRAGGTSTTLSGTESPLHAGHISGPNGSVVTISSGIAATI